METEAAKDKNEAVIEDKVYEQRQCVERLKTYQIRFYKLEAVLFENTLMIEQDETFLINVKKIDPPLHLQASIAQRAQPTPPKEATPGNSSK